jgi:hypothetical protein
MTNM